MYVHVYVHLYYAVCIFCLVGGLNDANMDRKTRMPHSHISWWWRVLLKKVAQCKYRCSSHAVKRRCCVYKETSSLWQHTVASGHGDNVHEQGWLLSCTQLCSCLGCKNIALKQENGDRESGSDSHWTAGISANIMIMMTYTIIQISEFKYFLFRGDLFFITNRNI